MGGLCAVLSSLALPSPAYGDVIQDPPTVQVTSGNAPVTWTHEVRPGTDRYAIVAVTLGQVMGTPPTARSVTFAGRAMSHLGGVANGVVVRVDLWGLPDPPVGPQPVELTLASDAAVVAGSLSFSGLDLAAPLGPVATATGAGPIAAVTVASALGDHVLDVYGSHEGQPTPVPGQSPNWIDRNAISSGSSSRPGAPTVTMAWDRTGGTDWAIAAVSLRPRLRTLPPPDAAAPDAGAPPPTDAATERPSAGTDAGGPPPAADAAAGGDGGAAGSGGGGSGGGGSGGDDSGADDGAAGSIGGREDAGPRRVQYDLGCACRSGAAPLDGRGLLPASLGLALVVRLARRRRRLEQAGRR